MAYRMKNLNCFGRQWMKEIALVDQIYMRLETQPDGHILQEDLEGVPFTKVIMESTVRGTPLSLRSSLVPILCWPRLTEKMLLQNCYRCYRCCYRLSDSEVNDDGPKSGLYENQINPGELQRPTTNSVKLQVYGLQLFIWQIHSFPSLSGKMNRNTLHSLE